MKYARTIIAVLLVAILVFAVGCSTELPAANDKVEDSATEEKTEEKADEATKEDGDDTFTLGISLLYRQDEFYKDLETAFIYEAEKHGIELVIQDANLDLAAQISHIEDFVTMGVDAITFGAVDPVGIAPAVEEAVAQGIPVFVFDSPIESDKTTSFIGFDLYRDGVILAEWALDYIDKEMGGKATIALLDFPAEPTNSVIRTNGFNDTIEAANNPDIKIVTRQDGGASRTISMAATENILTAHEDVDMIFGVNFDTCAGAKAACVAAGRDDIVICGLGWGVECFEALENNDPMYKAFFVPAPPILAENTMQVIADYKNGVEIEEVYEGESFIVTAETIGDYDWRTIVERREKYYEQLEG